MRKVAVLPLLLGGAALCSALGLATLRFGPPADAAGPTPQMSTDPAATTAAGTPPVTEVTPATESRAPLAAIAEARATPVLPPEEPSSSEQPASLSGAAPEAAIATAPAAQPDPVAAIPAVVSQPAAIVTVEDKAVALLAAMNAARASDGLNPLAWDADLAVVALARATDLVERAYFDHYGPDGSSAFSELSVRGIRYGLAGENLARNNYAESRTVEAAFQGLMGSPGHRANILEPRFQRVGVAAVRSGRIWLYVTVFTD